MPLLPLIKKFIDENLIWGIFIKVHSKMLLAINVCHWSIVKINRWIVYFPVDIYMFKFNNRGTRTRCEIYSKLTIKLTISHLVLVFLLLNVSR